MQKTVLNRIDEQTSKPRILDLWRALQSLQSCVSFMNSGAHPDDETSAFLAVLSLKHGISMSYVCANRGEGGQNDIGSQVTFDLGAIRTAEMEQAADALGLRMYWLSESPEDSITDFGFSKSGVETLQKWGHARALSQLVAVLRTEKPDILCPTFLNIPGQHGHHRAMTQLAHEAVDAAADENYSASSLPVWQVKKMYLPAWSGAGDAYDDDLPPPPATLVIDGTGEDPVSGWTYEQIGQHSRRFHLTQGMGRWITPGAERNWPLHLAQTVTTTPDTDILSGLPATLAELAHFADAADIADSLAEAQSAIQQATAQFPDLVAVRQHASHALQLVRHAMDQCPQSARTEVDHRLLLKESQLATVIRLASRASARAWLSADSVRGGEQVPVNIESTSGDAEAFDLTMQLPAGWRHADNALHVPEDAVTTRHYPVSHFPNAPSNPSLQMSLTVDGVTSVTLAAIETPPLVLPQFSARIETSSAVLNTTSERRELLIELSEQFPQAATPDLMMPEGWHHEKVDAGFTVTAPDDVSPGLYNFDLLLDGIPATTVNVFRFPHINPCLRSYPARVSVRVLSATIQNVKIGYVGGGNDRVADWLVAMGFNVKLLSDADLQQGSSLANLDTLVIGLFAIRTRPILQSIMPNIHRWIEGGGNLLTLYHRPWDDWNELTIPPKRLLIGKPSLRWRVTDENASVTHLLPSHPLLNSPNQITESDWQGWHKERGLYFAKQWDTAYEALLSMADPDEEPHRGALLSAQIGNGRHTHTSLILHHQMEKLVPGAFRIMANLVCQP